MISLAFESAHRHLLKRREPKEMQEQSAPQVSLTFVVPCVGKHFSVKIRCYSHEGLEAK